MLRRCLHVVWSVPLTDHNVAQVRSYTAFAVVYTLKRSFIFLASRSSFKIDPIYLQFVRRRMVLAIPLFFSSWLWHVLVWIGLLFGHSPQLCGVTGERSVLVLSGMTTTHICHIWDTCSGTVTHFV